MLRDRALWKTTAGKWLGWLIVVVTAQQIVVLILATQPNDAFHSMLSGLVSLPSSILACSICLMVAPKTPLPRVWRLFGLAILCLLLGDVNWVILQSVLQLSPYPSLSDVFYIAVMFIFGWGLLLLPQTRLSRLERIRVLLNIGVAVITAGTLLWVFLLAQIIKNQNPWLETLISIAYPVVDLALLAIALFAFFRPSEQILRREITFLLLGVAFLTIADVGFAWANAHKIQADNLITDGFWSWFSLCIAVAAVNNLKAKPSSPTQYSPNTPRSPCL